MFCSCRRRVAACVQLAGFGLAHMQGGQVCAEVGRTEAVESYLPELVAIEQLYTVAYW